MYVEGTKTFLKLLKFIQIQMFDKKTKCLTKS